MVDSVSDIAGRSLTLQTQHYSSCPRNSSCAHLLRSTALPPLAVLDSRTASSCFEHGSAAPSHPERHSSHLPWFIFASQLSTTRKIILRPRCQRRSLFTLSLSLAFTLSSGSQALGYRDSSTGHWHPCCNSHATAAQAKRVKTASISFI